MVKYILRKLLLLSKRAKGSDNNFQRPFHSRIVMKNFIVIFYIFWCTASISQSKQDYIWLFGLDDYDLTLPGLQGVIYNFNNKPFEPKITDLGIGIHSNNASICDKYGQLLFYSNGCAILNAQNKVMPNGDSINPGLFFDTL